MAKLAIFNGADGNPIIFLDDVELKGVTRYEIHQEPLSLADFEVHFAIAELEVNGEAIGVKCIADMRGEE